MRKERLSAAQDVAEKLFEAEAALDIAIARAAELMAAIPTARSAANLSAVVGQDAIETATAVLPALANARQKLVATHENLDDAKTQIGLGHTSFGGSGGKPPVQGNATLKVVGKAA